MVLRTLLLLLVGLMMTAMTAAQIPRPHQSSPRPDEQMPLPTPQLSQEETRKANYEKSLKDVRELTKLAEDLKTDLEKSDGFTLSLTSVKKAEQIEKLAKQIRSTIKRF